jgi:hypothetical protein
MQLSQLSLMGAVSVLLLTGTATAQDCAAVNAYLNKIHPSVEILCKPSFLQTVLSTYGCAEVAPGCGDYVCATNIPTDVVSSLANCELP